MKKIAEMDKEKRVRKEKGIVSPRKNSVEEFQSSPPLEVKNME